MSLPVRELTRIVKVLTKRWPRCTVGKPSEDGYHEVRDASGNLIIAHHDLGECLRAAEKLARSKP